MRVLLINPFYPISETPSPPLGLSYLAGALSAAWFAGEYLHPFEMLGGALVLCAAVLELWPRHQRV